MDSVSLAKIPLILCVFLHPCRTESEETNDQNIQHKEPKLSDADLNILIKYIGKNTVVSSFSFRWPLCKLAAATSTATRHEIISVLDIQTLSQTKTCYTGLFPTLGHIFETDLTSLNKIYVNYTDDVDDRFFTNASTFGLTVSKVGFSYQSEAVSYINEEFSSKTYMRIRDILELSDINPNSSILLVNGFHYKGTWEIPFMPNKQQKYYFMNGRQLDMMQALTQCSFFDDTQMGFKVSFECDHQLEGYSCHLRKVGEIEALTLTAISLRLSQRSTYITFILPYQHLSMNQLLNHMSKDTNFLDSLEKKMHWKFVNVAIPKFTIKTCMNWIPYFRQIGLRQTTDPENEELNTILKDGINATNNMYVSLAKQKIFFELDGGTKYDMPPLFAEPRVRPEIAREGDEGPDMPRTPVKMVQHFTADKPVFFAVAMTAAGKSKPDNYHDDKPENKVYRLLSGVFYGPE